MNKKKSFKWLRTVAGCILFSLLFTNCALADSSTSAPNVQSGNYDLSTPGTILVYKNETNQGGMNLATDSMTTDPKLTDIAINGSTIGAASMIDLGQVDFNGVTSAPASGYSYELSVTPNDVYVVSTHDNRFAKLQIQMVTASNVLFRYAYLQSNDVPSSSQSSQTSYTFQEGQSVVLTWPADSQAKSYDILRSDNGGDYVQMTDFKLTSPTFTDNNCLVNHTYLYKYISYDSSGNKINESDPITVTIVPKDSQNSQTKIVMRIDSNTVSVNGETEQLDTAPTIVDGRTLVPFRFIGEALGAKVGWDEADKKVTLTLGTHTIELWVDQHGAMVDGKSVTLDVPPKVINNRTMVPIRFVSENLNLQVGFDNATNTVTITGNATSSGNNPQPSNPQPSIDLRFYYHSWNMYVPGSVDENGNVASLGSSAGTLTINSDGTYQYVGGIDEGKGTWSSTGDSEYPIVMTDSATGNQWKVGQATSPNTSDIVVWDGYVYKYGELSN